MMSVTLIGLHLIPASSPLSQVHHDFWTSRWLYVDEVVNLSLSVFTLINDIVLGSKGQQWKNLKRLKFKLFVLAAYVASVF